LTIAVLASRWYLRNLRALWAITIAFCLLVVGRQSSELDVRRENHGSTVEAAKHPCVAAHLVRRFGGTPDAHERTPLIVAPPADDAAPPRFVVVATSERAPAPPPASFVRTHSSRGPPLSIAL
jgi:hypothetical protein